MGELTYYVNGQWVPAEQAALPLSDLGIVRGYGVFDFLRTYRHTPFHLREHLVRLENSARQIGIALPWSLDELDRLVREANDRNGLADATIRIVVTGGPSKSFLMPEGNPSLVIMVQPNTTYPATYFTEGTTAVTTAMERLMPTVKSLNYIGAIMAVTEATTHHAVEAIYRDAAGNLTEGTRSNFFVIRDGKLITPGRGILNGITRQVVMEVAAGEFEIVEGEIRFDELDQVEEAFLTSTTKEVLPVVQIDHHRIGNGRVGECTDRLMELFRAHVESVCGPIGQPA